MLLINLLGSTANCWGGSRLALNRLFRVLKTSYLLVTVALHRGCDSSSSSEAASYGEMDTGGQEGF